jgi:hypothetical protein
MPVAGKALPAVGHRGLGDVHRDQLVAQITLKVPAPASSPVAQRL